MNTNPKYPEITVGMAIEVLSIVDEGVIIVDNNLHVKFMNEAARKDFDLAVDTIEGMTFIEVVRDYECDALLRSSMISRKMESSEIRTHQGRKLLFVSIFPEHDLSDYFIVVRDYTERQHLEDMRHDLISNIAHELRTPITSIKLMAETLMSHINENDPISINFLKKMGTELSKLQEMTDDLSELSALESTRIVLEKDLIDIGRMIKRVMERLIAQAKNKGISINLNIEPGIPKLPVNKAQIESVLVNLIYNAIKYTGKGGRIDIKASKKDDNILVSVTDNGTGIPANELARIFERFYKVDKSRNTEGSGLGLAISKHIILSHGGKIWAESEEGKGSTFSFTLPLSTT